MREGWKTIPFEKSIQKVKYTTKIPSSEYLPQGLFPIVSQEEGLISGYWDNDADVFHHNKPVVIFGDHTRIIKYVDFDFVLGADGVKILVPVEGLSAKFLSYYLRWYKVPSLGYSRHFKLLKEASVPIPPIQDQEKIVAELDCLNGIIEKKKQQQEQLDKLAQSIFYEMFGDPIINEKGWEMKKLEEMVSASCSISYGIVQPGDGELTGVPVVRPVDLRDTFTHNVGLKLTTKEISNAYKRTILKGNELLLCVRGTTGIVSLAAKDLSGCNVSRGISPLEFNSSNNRFFMLYQFKAPSVQMIIADLTHGIALKGMNMADVRKMRLSQPPIDLQNEFAKKIEAIEKQKELVKQSIVETETLFSSRMDFWFNN